VNNDIGEEFFQELFEKEHDANIILQHPRSRPKTMMKRKEKAPTKE
jgi:hypothetical protein